MAHPFLSWDPDLVERKLTLVKSGQMEQRELLSVVLEFGELLQKGARDIVNTEQRMYREFLPRMKSAEFYHVM
jgi:hypothetical protein